MNATIHGVVVCASGIWGMWNDTLAPRPHGNRILKPKPFAGGVPVRMTLAIHVQVYLDLALESQPEPEHTAGGIAACLYRR